MEWSKLLLDKTFRPRSPLKDFDGRDPFENDYGRIISSPFIRRLQDKTQVFPLEESDFIRTRLTHSLEVSSIARSLGKTVEKKLIYDKQLDPQYQGHIPSLLSLAGLVHDLGNPPYGHFGESAIQSFFKNFFSNNSNYNQNIWTEQEKQDFINFDGNVQTFRILRKLSLLNDEFSYNITYPTLASIIKYPRNSLTGNKKKAATDIIEKKFGFFTTEENDYKAISDELGLDGRRHPVVFLLEAADDIAYSAADIEDGVKLGSLDFDIIYGTFEHELATDPTKTKILSGLEKFYSDAKKCPSDRLDLTVRNFRIFTQGIMIADTLEEFFKNYDGIMLGTYKEEVIMNSAAKNIRTAYKKLGNIVYGNKKVIQAELTGWQVLKGLLEVFVPSSQSSNFKSSGNTFESRLYNMISSSFRYMYEGFPGVYNSENQEYRKIQLITDFISGMTDSYALNYYHKLAGIKV